MSLLRVEHLKKYYSAPSPLLGPRRFVRALDDVSFELNEGETLGLVGESGCGKSTLARQLIRLETPTDGKIYLDGTDMGTLTGRKLREMRGNFQMIFQDPYASLNPRMSVYSMLEEALKLHSTLNAGERAERITELLRQVGLNPAHARRYPHQFSGGQRQRIGIARALAVRPKFIVADEPVSALDVSVQSQIVNLLKDIQAETGVAFLFIAHDLAVVEHISHRIMVMYLGRITETGPARELCAHPAHPYTRALLSSVPAIRPKTKRERIILTGDVPSPLNPPSGCRFHPRCPCRQTICEQVEPELRCVGNNEKHLCACHFPLLSVEKTEKD